MKKCPDCRESKPLEDFYKDSSKRDGLDIRCKDCKRQRNKAYYAKNSEQELARNKKYRGANKERLAEIKKEYNLREAPAVKNRRLKYVYRITLDQYYAMLEDQNGVCAICKKENKNGLALSVDHNHQCCVGNRSCGKCVRRLLCNRCNTGIGAFEDDIDLMEAAIEYIRAHNKTL